MSTVNDTPIPLPPGPPAPEDPAAMLLEYLAGHDVPCPLCGYNLRGLAAPRCPECGREVRFTVTLAEPYLRAWVGLAVATLGSAGVGLFFLLMFLPRGGFRGNPGYEAITMALLAWFWACMPLSGLVLWLRRPFVRLDKAAQRVLAAAAWVISVGAFAGLVAVFS